MIILLFLLSLSLFSCINAEWTYIPFDIAMKKNSSHSWQQICATTKQIVGIDGYALYNFFKDMYEQNNLSMIAPSSQLKIPKIIHQIWLGSPVPESFKVLQQSWIAHHIGRDWLYKLWTDEDVKHMHLYNQEFYDATDNYGIKSDILRLEIIYHYGGVYIDMDYECLQALDDLHYTYDFYTALQPLDTSFIQLGSALFGACPKHPIIKHCIETVKDDWHLKGAPKKTGPVHFTKSFYACASTKGNKDIAFPAFYFYPLGCQETEENRNSWTKQGAFAVHWWAKSWMPKIYRRTTFKNINNEKSTENWNS